MCYVLYRYGEDTVSCQLQCEGKSGVQLQTLHPDALDKIAKIELTGTLVTHSGDLGLTIVLCSILCVVFACKLNPLNPVKLRFWRLFYIFCREWKCCTSSCQRYWTTQVCLCFQPKLRDFWRSKLPLGSQVDSCWRSQLESGMVQGRQTPAHWSQV